MAAKNAFSAMVAALDPNIHVPTVFGPQCALHILFAVSCRGKDKDSPTGATTLKQIRCWIDALLDAQVVAPRDGENHQDAPFPAHINSANGGIISLQSADGSSCSIHTVPLVNRGPSALQRGAAARLEGLLAASIEPSGEATRKHIGPDAATVVVVVVKLPHKIETSSRKGKSWRTEEQRKVPLLPDLVPVPLSDENRDVHDPLLPLRLRQTALVMAVRSSLSAVAEPQQLLHEAPSPAPCLPLPLPFSDGSCLPFSCRWSNFYFVSDDFLRRTIFFKKWCFPGDFISDDHLTSPSLFEQERPLPVVCATAGASNIACAPLLAGISQVALVDAFELEGLWYAVRAKALLLPKPSSAHQPKQLSRRDRSFGRPTPDSPPLLLTHITAMTVAERQSSTNEAARREGVLETALRQLVTASLFLTVNTCGCQPPVPWFMSKSAEGAVAAVEWLCSKSSAESQQLAPGMSLDHAMDLLQNLADLQHKAPPASHVTAGDGRLDGSVEMLPSVASSAASVFAVQHAVLQTDVALSLTLVAKGKLPSVVSTSSIDN